VAGYYEVNGSVGQACTPQANQIVAGIYKNDTLVAQGETVTSTAASIGVVSDLVYLDGVNDYISLQCYMTFTGSGGFQSNTAQTFLSAVLVSGNTSTGGSGGGDYTPEALVWEDKLANRVIDTVYTNNDDVPRYVQIYIGTTGLQNAQFKIDGTSFGYIGNSDADSISNQTPLFLVPAGSTYELDIGAGLPTIVEWHEARMPVAVGGGDAEPPVVLKASFSTDSAIPNNAWTPITFNVADVDTNDGLDVANKWYKPNVAGYYNVALSTQTSGTGLTRGVSGVWKNDERVQTGTETWNDAVPISSITSLTNTIVYCNGTTDYIQSKVLTVGASDLKLQSGFGTQLNISRIGGSSSGSGYNTRVAELEARLNKLEKRMK